MKSIRPLIGAAVAAVCTVLVVQAQQRPEAGVDVIVVFAEGANFDAFRGGAQDDPRAAANPAAWGYLDRGVVGAVQALERARGFSATHVYSASMRGFAARLTAAQIAALQNDARVAFVEADGPVSITQRPGGGGGGAAQVLPWGINRIDADVSSTVAGDGTGTVSGINVYIIDSGIDAKHGDLNVVNHVNFAGGKNADCNGHGTHVAGTVAARDNTTDVVGAAPGLALTGVKVLGCSGSGSFSGVIKGVDWVTANAVKPAAANMSLGGGVSDALDTAVRNSAASGVFYALAAGNSGTDACSSSPARAGAGTDNGIMTTAATDAADGEASWSNFGACVDVWAPGVSILSTRSGGGTTTMSGTSMASPHVAGTVALLQRMQPGASAAALETLLKGDGLFTGTLSKDGRSILLISARRY